MSAYPTMKITDEWVSQVRQRATATLVLSGHDQGADLTQWCGSVFNQLQEGSCTACTTRDYLLWLQNKYGYKTITDPSVNVLYYFARKLFNDLSTDSGSTVGDAFEGSVMYGVIPSSDETYSRDTLFIEPPMQDVVFKASSFQCLPPNTSSIRASLDNGIPVGIAVGVDQQLFAPVDTTDGLVAVVDIYKEVPNEGHALFIPKYLPHPRYGFIYRAQGSWGEGYGDKGYIWLTEAYMQKYLFQVCTLDIPKTLTPPTPVPKPKPSPKPQPEVFPMLETDLQEHHKGIVVNGDTYVPPELWERAGAATQVDATHFTVNSKTYPGAIQNGTTYIHYQVMKDAGYVLTKINPIGWTFTKGA